MLNSNKQRDEQGGGEEEEESLNQQPSATAVSLSAGLLPHAWKAQWK